MRANRVSAVVFAVAASLAGCRSTGDVEYARGVRVSSPQLIDLSPGVQVVADADEPLFFADGHYWLYRDGYWLRATDYRGAFIRVDDLSYVPERIRSIDRPQMYVQYQRHVGRARTVEARAGDTTQPPPAGTHQVPRTNEPHPLPNQGVPSTPPAETWSPGQPRDPSAARGGINPVSSGAPGGIDPAPGTQVPGVPVDPNPTPPVTSPADVQGRPMPPHQAPPQADATDPASTGPVARDTTTSQGTASDRDDQATPPTPPTSPGNAVDPVP